MSLKYIVLLLFTATLFACSDSDDQSSVLLYTKNGEGFVHENIPSSIRAIQELGAANGFLVNVSDDPAIFNSDSLMLFDAVIFSNTNNNVFENEEQKEQFMKFIGSGGGFAAIHSATGTERNWPWFHQLIGAKFERHAPFQEFTARVVKVHPSTSFLGKTWLREDEAYYFKKMNPTIDVLMVHDMTTVEDAKKGEYPGDIFGDVYPSVWTNNFLGARQWYTSYGHDASHYDDEEFRKHLLGGILWVLGKERDYE